MKPPCGMGRGSLGLRGTCPRLGFTVKSESTVKNSPQWFVNSAAKAASCRRISPNFASFTQVSDSRTPLAFRLLALPPGCNPLRERIREVSADCDLRLMSGAVQNNFQFFLFFTWQAVWTFDMFLKVKVAPRMATDG